MRAFGDEPIRGVGAGGWAVYWLRYRPIGEFANDAHSLPVQTLAELGLVGLALLAMFLAGLVLGGPDRPPGRPGAGGGTDRRMRRLLRALATGLGLGNAGRDAVRAAAGRGADCAGRFTDRGRSTQSSSAIRGASRRKIQTASTQITM